MKRILLGIATSLFAVVAHADTYSCENNKASLTLEVEDTHVCVKKMLPWCLNYLRLGEAPKSNNPLDQMAKPDHIITAVEEDMIREMNYGEALDVLYVNYLMLNTETLDMNFQRVAFELDGTPYEVIETNSKKYKCVRN